MSDDDVTIIPPDAHLTDEEEDQLMLERMLQSVNQNRRAKTKRLRLSGMGGASIVIRAMDEADFEAMRRQESDTDEAFTRRMAKMVQRALVSPRMDEKFLGQLGVTTVEDALRVSLLPGELVRIVEQITILSGFGTDAVEAAKNSSGETG